MYVSARSVLMTRILAFVLIGAAAYGGYRLVRFLVLPGTDLSDRAKIERYAHIQFPTGARDIHACVEGWQDPMTCVRFTLPPEELDLFLSTTGIEQPLKSEKVSDLFAHPPVQLHRSWWAPPANLTRFRAGSGERKYEGKDADGEYSEEVTHHVLVDESNPGPVTVWFISQ
jgi:hypothetical protein